MRPLVSLGLALSLAAAAAPASAAAPQHAAPLDVMSQNLYIGADVFRILGVPPAEVPLVAAQILATVVATDFPSRADAIAAEIAHRRPHLVGLQEVALLRVQSPGDAIFGNPVPAEDVWFDYLDILLDRLAAHGADYEVAAVAWNVDAELPFLAGFSGGLPLLDDVRVTDRDVVLVRGDVEWSDATAANYGAFVPFSVGGFVIPYLRGWAAVDATVHGRAVRFVNTHLEVAAAGPVQTLQAMELAQELAGEPLPVVLVGDFNSEPTDPAPSPYGVLAAAGFTDAWLERVGRPVAGSTCCHVETLDNPVPDLDERIDHVWVRNDPRPSALAPVRAVRFELFGDEPGEMTATGLWPSDHAGLSAHLVLPATR